jgi:hypothetical protein
MHPMQTLSRVITLVKNDLVARANVHLCPDLMDSRTQSIWLQFGPISFSSSSSSSSSTMGAFTLCGVYRTWSDHDGPVFTVPEATKQLQALNIQISSATERYARVVVHGDLNLDLDRSEDVHYARKRL